MTVTCVKKLMIYARMRDVKGSVVGVMGVAKAVSMELMDNAGCRRSNFMPPPPRAFFSDDAIQFEILFNNKSNSFFGNC